MRLSNRLILLFSIVIIIWSCQPSSSDSKQGELATQQKSENLKPSSFEQWFSNPMPMVSAHRGGPYPGYPENAIETFEYIVNRTSAVIECDIAMTKDSVLLMMHDQTLDRTTTGSGKVSELNYEEIRNLYLVDNNGDSTAFKAPTLDQVLQWGDGRALFTLDVKRGVPFEKVVDAMKAYNASSYAAIITYRIQDAVLVHQLDSTIIISVSAGSEEALNQIKKSGIPSRNLLGFVGVREPDRNHYEKLEEMGIKTILGTLGNLDKSAEARGDDAIYLTYIENGANIIATDRPLEVAKVINETY
jgi:glycerophosphoryl diester phosphodiesterase